MRSALQTYTAYICDCRKIKKNTCLIIVLHICAIGLYVVGTLALMGATAFGSVSSTYPIQLSGSLWQSVLHPKRSHDNQPIGGVSARPLSRQWPTRTASATNSNEAHQLPDEIAIVHLQFLQFD